MSVVSKNPFDLLGDDGDESPAPAPKSAPKKADAPAAAPARAVPGASAKPAAGGARGGRNAPRGAPRTNRNEGDRNTGPTSSEGVAVGMETPGGFDGERVPNSRKSNHIRDAHTKGPRSERPVKNYTSGGHTSSRGGGAGGKVPVGGGERRQFERRSGGLPDSQKKVDQGWGANEGEAELTAEVQGEADAVVEENEPQTPAPEAEGDAAPVEAAEPEEIQKGLDEYLAERAAAAVSFGKKEGRQVNADTLEGQEFRRAGIDEFYAPKEKSAPKSTKTAAKKEKVYIAVDGQFATPPGGGSDSKRGSDRPFRGGDRTERGGRGGGAGGERGSSGRGRGGPRGARGGARGGNAAGRGGAGGAARTANLDSNDQTAFPALGA